MTLHLGKGRSFATALVSFLASFLASVVVPAVVLALASLALPAVTSPAGAATR